jgi:preprotein translocase SecE subunit
LGVQIPPGLLLQRVLGSLGCISLHTLICEQCAMREYVARVTTFLQDVQAETKKVTWPSRRDVVGSTLVVIVAVFIIAGFLGIIDFILSLLIGALFK